MTKELVFEFLKLTFDEQMKQKSFNTIIMVSPDSIARDEADFYREILQKMNLIDSFFNLTGNGFSIVLDVPTNQTLACQRNCLQMV